jgi:hypothetical protein
MVLLMVAVPVSEDALAVLVLLPEVSAGNENTGMDGDWEGFFDTLWEGFFWRMPKQAYTVPCRASHPHGQGAQDLCT